MKQNVNAVKTIDVEILVQCNMTAKHVTAADHQGPFCRHLRSFDGEVSN